MIYTLGESLLDVIVESPDRVIARAGGAMLNVAVSLARAKQEVSMISELGDDTTSKFILDFLKSNQVETPYIKKYFRNNTALALAFLDEHKKPAYTFYKTYPKSRRLLSPADFGEDDVLLFGSIYSLDGNLRNELLELVVAAKREGAFIFYDPNIRHGHHLANEATRKALLENLAMADLIKGSDEDFKNIFGEHSFDTWYKELRKHNASAPLVITRGAKGVAAFTQDVRLDLPAAPLKPVSTIGAGDAFTAGMAFALVRSAMHKQKELSEKQMGTLLEFGLSFSAVVCRSWDNYIPSSFQPKDSV